MPQRTFGEKLSSVLPESTLDKGNAASFRINEGSCAPSTAIMAPAACSGSGQQNPCMIRSASITRQGMLESLIPSSHTGVLAFGGDLIVTCADKVATALLDGMVGQSVLEFLPVEQHQLFQDIVACVSPQQDPASIRFVLRSIDHLACVSTLCRDHAATCPRYIMVVMGSLVERSDMWRQPSVESSVVSFALSADSSSVGPVVPLTEVSVMTDIGWGKLGFECRRCKKPPLAPDAQDRSLPALASTAAKRRHSKQMSRTPDASRGGAGNSAGVNQPSRNRSDSDTSLPHGVRAGLFDGLWVLSSPMAGIHQWLHSLDIKGAVAWDGEGDSISILQDEEGWPMLDGGRLVVQDDILVRMGRAGGMVLQYARTQSTAPVDQ